MPSKSRGGWFTRGKRKSTSANGGISKSTSAHSCPKDLDQLVNELDYPIIQESDVPFYTISNMLPGDHPFYHHMNKIYAEFVELSDAINDMKFESVYNHQRMVELQGHTSRINEIAKEMISTHESQ
jgi:hypothetical protein